MSSITFSVIHESDLLPLLFEIELIEFFGVCVAFDNITVSTKVIAAMEFSHIHLNDMVVVDTVKKEDEP